MTTADLMLKFCYCILRQEIDQYTKSDFTNYNTFELNAKIYANICQQKITNNYSNPEFKQSSFDQCIDNLIIKSANPQLITSSYMDTQFTDNLLNNYTLSLEPVDSDTIKPSFFIIIFLIILYSLTIFVSIVGK